MKNIPDIVHETGWNKKKIDKRRAESDYCNFVIALIVILFVVWVASGIYSSIRNKQLQKEMDCRDPELFTKECYER